MAELDATSAAVASPVPRSVGRVLDLLEIVLAKPRNLTDSAHAAGLTPTTALRHLRALEARGYVARDASNVYSAGPAMRRMSASLHDGGELERMIDAIQPQLDALCAASGESVYLAVGDGRVASYVAAAHSERAIRHVAWIGQTVPMANTAVGEAMRAPGAPVARTGAVEPDIAAVSIGLGTVGSVSLAISVVGPSHRFTAPQRTRHADDLLRTANDLSPVLGITPSRAS